MVTVQLLSHSKKMEPQFTAFTRFGYVCCLSFCLSVCVCCMFNSSLLWFREAIEGSKLRDVLLSLQMRFMFVCLSDSLKTQTLSLLLILCQTIFLINLFLYFAVIQTCRAPMVTKTTTSLKKTICRRQPQLQQQLRPRSHLLAQPHLHCTWETWTTLQQRSKKHCQIRTFSHDLLFHTTDLLALTGLKTFYSWRLVQFPDPQESKTKEKTREEIIVKKCRQLLHPQKLFTQ